MKMESLKDLFVDELRDMLSAEKQIVSALPKMAKGANSPQLKTAFEEHLAQTRGHVERLKQVFETVGKSARSKHCKGMEGLLEEGSELLEEDADPDVLDAALIAAAQKVEHYEISGYGTLRTYAALLGLKDAASLLQQTLDEEGATDKKLTDLAVGGINIEAND
jgi:ferritin-like metal-binding protein YciE